MHAAPLPPLFDRIPAGLFAPLTGPYAPLHWQVLAVFYQYEFEREPLYLVRETAHELAVDALASAPVWRERRDDLLALDAELDPGETTDPADEVALLRAAARRLLTRLERAGWYHFEYRSAVGHVLAFHPYAARLLETLVRVARDEQPLFQGYAHAIATLLRPESTAGRPGIALREAKRQTLDLMRELKILERNIHGFTQRLLDRAVTAADVLEEGLERYRSAVLANYHRLKTVDNLYKWRGEILSRLDALEHDPLFQDGATCWVAEQDGTDRSAAAATVADDLRLLRAEFDALPQLVDDIDRRNARFSGVALRRLMYLLRHDRRLEGQLQLVVDRLARDRTPELELDVFSCQLLGDAFLYTAPKKRAPAVRQPLLRKPKANADDVRRTVTARLRRPYGRARVDAFVESLLAARPSIATSALPLATDQDYVQTIFTLAYAVDGRSPYRFDRGGGARVTQGAFGVPSGLIARRRERSR